MRATLQARLARRALATAIAAWFVVGVVLGARHEALVGHHVDARTGVAIHAPGVVGEHTGDHSDVHRSRSIADDGGGCAIVAALHAAACEARARGVVHAVDDVVIVAFAGVARTCSSANLLRFAPKTSPPSTSRVG